MIKTPDEATMNRIREMEKQGRFETVKTKREDFKQLYPKDSKGFRVIADGVSVLLQW
jgi:hypothetical protein